MTWHDIITTVCEPFMQQQDIVMGIPEVTVGRTTIKLGVPQVTMKRQDWYFDLPKFHITDGCIGSRCEKKCEDASQRYSNDYQSIVNPAIKSAKTSIAKANADSLGCQRSVLVQQKEAALASIDANVGVVKASLATLQGMGATDQAKSVSDTLSKLMEMRAKVSAQFDGLIQNVDDQSKKTTGDLLATQ